MGETAGSGRDTGLPEGAQARERRVRAVGFICECQ